MHGGQATRSHFRRRAVALTFAMAGCSVALAACGSSSKSSNPSTSSSIKFVDCMRSHGVPNLPDLNAEGGLQIQAGSGINPQSPAFKAAQARCGKLLSQGRSGGRGPPSEGVMEQMLAVSKCMRDHNISGFPDPTPGPPPSNPQEFSIAMGRGGVSLLVPNTVDVSSPAFKRAASTCHFGSLLGAGRRTLAPS